MTLLKNAPDLFMHFDKEKNKDIDLSILTTGSRTIVFWKCCNGHSFERKMADFNRSKSCKKCRMKENSLFENKKIMKEWDFSKNKDLNPKEINQNNNRLKVAWICKECSHQWNARVHSRAKKNSGCPKCASTKQHSKNEIRLYSELKTIFNEVVSDYKLEGFSYDIYIKDINLLIEYDGFKWHKDRYEKDMDKNIIASNNGFKLIRLREKGLNKLSDSDISIPFDFNIKRDFDTQKKLVNLLLEKINELFYQEEKIFDEYINEKSFKNIDEYNKYEHKIKHKNTVKDNPLLLSQWDLKKNNNIDAGSVSLKTSRLYWWKCDKGEDHSWESSPLNRQKRGCPFCSNKSVSITNRFDLNEIDLLKAWNYKLNKKSPSEYTNRQSTDKINWICLSCSSPIIKSIRSMVDTKGYCKVCKYKNKKNDDLENHHSSVF